MYVGRLILREVAQTTDADEKDFQNIEKHSFFNTNNLWIRLDKLAALMDAKGALPLPLIVAEKTVDPKDDTSTPVVQLETAMGAAVQFFGLNSLHIPADRPSSEEPSYSLQLFLQMEPGLFLFHVRALHQ